LAVDLQETFKLSREDISMMKKTLSVIFPDESAVSRRFLLKLTPNELKNAYMRQVADCHPKLVNGLSPEEEKARQIQYQRLFQAYNTLLPHIKAIHDKVQAAEPPDRTILNHRIERFLLWVVLKAGLVNQ